MAGKLRHWKEKSGRFYARMGVPAHLKTIIGKGEILASLGSDRRIAMRKHAAEVMALQHQIAQAQAIYDERNGAQITSAQDHLNPITSRDFARAVWDRYSAALAEDDAARLRHPTPTQVDALHEQLIKDIQETGTPDSKIEILAHSLDWLVARDSRDFDRIAREAKLKELKRTLTTGETHLIEHEVEAFLSKHKIEAAPGTSERTVLTRNLIRAEIEALRRAQERDEGDYTGQPSDPIVRRPAAEPEALPPLELEFLWRNYVKYRQTLGFMKDGGRRQFLPVQSLIDHCGFSDARRVTKADLRAWQEAVSARLAAKTIQKVYVPTIKAVFRWAFDTDRLPDNPAATMRVDAPRVTVTREKGFNNDEAEALLRYARDYEPFVTQNGRPLEGVKMTAAKRWISLIAAHTGARVGEIAQLRREDFREEQGVIIARITPDAGATKTGEYRDVPLHPQLIDLGLMDYIASIPSGPIFTTATKPEKYREAAKKVANTVGSWLRDSGLVPPDVWPSHGFRHAFKTRGREAEIQDRVLDAIQGHAPRTMGDTYGEVSIRTRIDAINKMPRYNLTE